MKLVQTLEKPVYGYWDGGLKQRFEWSIKGKPQIDSHGVYVRVGSFDANFWFSVAVGKTDKLTLSYAKSRIKAFTKVPSTFEYVED